MLESKRIRLAERLARVKHVTAKNALEQARDEIRARLDEGALRDRDQAVEENVLMFVERELATFFNE